MSVDKKLLMILVCPVCKGDLEYDNSHEELICHTCQMAFPVQDDIPIMLETEARRTDNVS